MYNVGDIVIVKGNFIHTPDTNNNHSPDQDNRSLGIIYEKYNFGDNFHGVSVVLSDGTDLSGFGEHEYNLLEYVGSFTNLKYYEFKNAIQFSKDIDRIFGGYLNYLEDHKGYILRDHTIKKLLNLK